MKDLLRYLDSLSKLDYASYIVTIAKIAPNQIGALIRFRSFFCPRVRFISVDLPCGLHLMPLS